MEHFCPGGCCCSLQTCTTPQEILFEESYPAGFTRNVDGSSTLNLPYYKSRPTSYQPRALRLALHELRGRRDLAAQRHRCHPRAARGGTAGRGSNLINAKVLAPWRPMRPPLRREVNGLLVAARTTTRARRATRGTWTLQQLETLIPALT